MASHIVNNHCSDDEALTSVAGAASSRQCRGRGSFLRLLAGMLFMGVPAAVLECKHLCEMLHGRLLVVVHQKVASFFTVTSTLLIFATLMTPSFTPGSSWAFMFSVLTCPLRGAGKIAERMVCRLDNCSHV